MTTETQAIYKAQLAVDNCIMIVQAKLAKHMQPLNDGSLMFDGSNIRDLVDQVKELRAIRDALRIS